MVGAKPQECVDCRQGPRRPGSPLGGQPRHPRPLHTMRDGRCCAFWHPRPPLKVPTGGGRLGGAPAPQAPAGSREDGATPLPCPTPSPGAPSRVGGPCTVPDLGTPRSVTVTVCWDPRPQPATPQAPRGPHCTHETPEPKVRSAGLSPQPLQAAPSGWKGPRPGPASGTSPSGSAPPSPGLQGSAGIGKELRLESFPRKPLWPPPHQITLGAPTSHPAGARPLERP